MASALDTAPGIPGGASIDFNKFHSEVAKGNGDAAAAATVKETPPAAAKGEAGAAQHSAAAKPTA